MLIELKNKYHFLMVSLYFFFHWPYLVTHGLFVLLCCELYPHNYVFTIFFLLKCSSLLSVQPNPNQNLSVLFAFFWFNCFNSIAESSEIPTKFPPTSAKRTNIHHSLCIISIVSHYGNCVHNFNPFCSPFFFIIHFHSRIVFFCSLSLFEIV